MIVGEHATDDEAAARFSGAPLPSLPSENGTFLSRLSRDPCGRGLPAEKPRSSARATWLPRS